jgi:hypothetical protein
MCVCMFTCVVSVSIRACTNTCMYFHVAWHKHTYIHIYMHTQVYYLIVLTLWTAGFVVHNDKCTVNVVGLRLATGAIGLITFVVMSMLIVSQLRKDLSTHMTWLGVTIRYVCVCVCVCMNDCVYVYMCICVSQLRKDLSTHITWLGVTIRYVCMYVCMCMKDYVWL